MHAHYYHQLKLDSDASLDIDLQNRIVEINTTVSQDQVIATLSDRGFTAEPINLC